MAFAVLLQGFIPAAAFKADEAPAAPFTFSICTLHGLEPAPGQGGKHRHFGGLACEQCVIASLAAVAAAAPLFAPPSVAAFLVQRPVRAVSLVARAFPHRPPSRAPPLSS